MNCDIMIVFVVGKFCCYDDLMMKLGPIIGVQKVLHYDELIDGETICLDDFLGPVM